jgi:hypothetical protein
MDDRVFQGIPPRRSIEKKFVEPKKSYLPHPSRAVKMTRHVEPGHFLLTPHVLLDN